MNQFWDPLYHLMPADWALSTILQVFLRPSQRSETSEVALMRAEEVLERCDKQASESLKKGCFCC